METATTTIILSNTHRWLEFIPFNWEALAAIATLLVVIFALYQHRSYLKQEELKRRREIGELVVLPLKNSLDDLLRWLSEKHFRNFELPLGKIKKEKLLLYINLEKDLQVQIENFNNQFKQFNNLSSQMQPMLSQIISNAFFKLQNQERKDFEFNNDSMPTPDDLNNIHLSSSLGGAAVTIYSLSLRGISLNDYFEESRKRLSLSNNTSVQNIKVSVPNVRKYPSDLGRDYFEKLLQTIENNFSKNKELLEYRSKWFALYRAGTELLDEFNQWLRTQ